MKSSIKKIILIFLILVIPLTIKADVTYRNAINYSNTYIDNFIEYDKYLIFPTKEWYYFNTVVPSDEITFSRGGFLSRKEYLITNENNNSYLSPGVQYWTLTPGEENKQMIYVIDYSDRQMEKSSTSGVRVTQFIESKVKVGGDGTRSKPWFFVPKYKISLETSDYRKGQILNEIGRDKKVSGECNNVVTTLSTNVYNDETIYIRVCPTPGYEFLGTNCTKNIKVDNNVLEINNVIKNITCKVNFAKEAYKIVLDTNGGSQIDIKELYLSPGLNWYKDKNSRIDDKPITKINMLPEKEGYVFTGFYTTTDGGTQIIDETGNIINKNAYKEDGTMYANWEGKEYNVKFDMQGGSQGTTNIIVKYGEEMPKITIPKKSVSMFDGYYTQPNGQGIKYYNADGSSAKNCDFNKDITLYAYWVVDRYLVEFDMQGGRDGTTSVKVAKGEPMPTITNPIKDGYTFGGYYTSKSGGGTQYYKVDGPSKKNYDKTTGLKLYAKWTVNKYTITYELDGGTAGKNKPTSPTYDTVVTIDNPTRAGYTFTGWTIISGLNTTTAKHGTTKTTVTNSIENSSTKITSKFFKNLTPSGSVTLKANWSANEYTITYNLNNGIAGSISPTSATYDKVVTIDNPTRVGYTFTGWTVTSGLNKTTSRHGESIDTVTSKIKDSSAKILSRYFKNITTGTSTTLTANWSANKYTITYELEGGTLEKNKPASATYDKVVTINNPTRAGYTFTGWTIISGLNTTTAKHGTKDSTVTNSIENPSTKITSKFFKNLTPSGSVTLKANWSANEYTITYKLDGGTAGTNKPTSATYDNVITIDNPTRVGYTFTGWTVTSGLNTSTAKHGESIDTVTSKIKDAKTKILSRYFKNITTGVSTTLTANWSANKYTVTLDGNGATSTGTTSVIATFASAMPSIKTKPTRTGYTFQGYYTEKDGKGTRYYKADGKSARTYDIPTNSTLYAYWIDEKAPTCTTSGESTTWFVGSRTITYGCSDDGSGCKVGKSGGSITFSNTTKTATIPAYTIEDNAGNVTKCKEKTVNVYIALEKTPKIVTCTKDSSCVEYSTPGCANHERCNYCAGYFEDNYIGCCYEYGWRYAHSGHCYKKVCSIYETYQSTCPSGYTQSGSASCPSNYPYSDSTSCYK